MKQREGRQKMLQKAKKIRNESINHLSQKEKELYEKEKIK